MDLLSNIFHLVLFIIKLLLMVCLNEQLILNSSTMKHKQVFSYSIIKDAHMYYFLQSAPKVRQLIETGLFKLQGNMLMQIGTKSSTKLDPYVLQQLKEIPFSQISRNQTFQETINTRKFQIFKEERAKVQKMRVNKSLQGSRVADIEKAYGSIKGLKQFMLKKVR